MRISSITRSAMRSSRSSSISISTSSATETFSTVLVVIVRISLPSSLYAKASDLTALAGRVTTLEGTTHTHANKDLLDTYTQTEVNLADAVAKKHNHANQSVLDGVTSEKVTAWDAAEQNAKTYADGLAVNYDAAGSATAAETNAKEYADTAVTNALTWGSF